MQTNLDGWLGAKRKKTPTCICIDIRLCMRIYLDEIQNSIMSICEDIQILVAEQYGQDSDECKKENEKNGSEKSS